MINVGWISREFPHDEIFYFFSLLVRTGSCFYQNFFVHPLLPIPENIVKEVNQLNFIFLWKDKDEVNSYEQSDLKMTET